MSLRVVRALMLTLVVLFLRPACVEPRGQRQGRLILVLVDVSATIRDRAKHEPAWERITTAFRACDRLVLVTVGGPDDRATANIADAMQTLVDVKAPCDPEMTRMRTNQLLLVERRKLRAVFKDLPDPNGRTTQLLFSIQHAASTFHGDNERQPLLIVLSDMLESSRQAEFEPTSPSQKQAQRIIAALRGDGLVPDLRGVRVAAVGASARTARDYARVRDFWVLYFKETGARLDIKTYGSLDGVLSVQ